MSAELTVEERTAISAVVHQNYFMPDVFAAVERIIEGRLAPDTMAVEELDASARELLPLRTLAEDELRAWRMGVAQMRSAVATGLGAARRRGSI